MTKNIEKHPLPYNSPSVVTFRSEVDEIELDSKSPWDPDWTIQREVSITIEYNDIFAFFYINCPLFSKSVSDSPKLCTKNLQIMIGITLCVVLILSVLLPVIILMSDPNISSSISGE
jgi:hypothetical protein